MTDIVERLRIRRNPMLDGEREEAAEEIERLREERKDQDAEVISQFATITHLKAEIERLRK